MLAITLKENCEGPSEMGMVVALYEIQPRLKSQALTTRTDL